MNLVSILQVPLPHLQQIQHSEQSSSFLQELLQVNWMFGINKFTATSSTFSGKLRNAITCIVGEVSSTAYKLNRRKSSY